MAESANSALHAQSTVETFDSEKSPEIGDALRALDNPSASGSRTGIISYEIVTGDTLSEIANRFDITVSTVLSANPTIRSRSLVPGQLLSILPVSGVLHARSSGESLVAIAALYDVAEATIKNWNPDPLPYKVIIPGAATVRNIETATSNLPSLPGFFIMPTTGQNWGDLHARNAVDIANSCGTPVFAAAEGLVSAVRSGWDQGYGNNIILEHPNGVRTRYAHLQSMKAKAGDYIFQGDEIGTIGNTGLVHGKTGCHLHFEIDGARNPFAK